MSTVRRVNRPADNFTMVSNGFARDEALSLAARGLGLWLLSHVDGWETTTERIAQLHNIGRDQTRRYLKELEQARYLRRTRERLAGNRLGGMIYEVQCTPFPEENPRSNLRLDYQSQAGQGLESGQHKKTTSKKTTTPEEQHPSGGATADAAPPSLEVPPSIDEQEEPMATPAAQDALFDVAPPVKARKAESPSARTVLAAFIDSYRQHHSGADPTTAARGRVARSAKAILESGRAAPEELTEAARAMGEGPYNNLDVALNIHRQGGQKRKGFTPGTPARPHTDADWLAVAERQEREQYDQLMADDELVRWISGDPAEVDKWTARYPELADRFRDVA